MVEVGDLSSMIRGITQYNHQIQISIILELENIDHQIIVIGHLCIILMADQRDTHVKIIIDMVVKMDLRCTRMLIHSIHHQLILINKSAKKSGKAHHIFDHSTDLMEWMDPKKNLICSTKPFKSNKTLTTTNISKLCTILNKTMTKE